MQKANGRVEKWGKPKNNRKKRSKQHLHLQSHKKGRFQGQISLGIINGVKGFQWSKDPRSLNLLNMKLAMFSEVGRERNLEKWGRRQSYDRQRGKVKLLH